MPGKRIEADRGLTPSHSEGWGWSVFFGEPGLVVAFVSEVVVEFGA